MEKRKGHQQVGQAERQWAYLCGVKMKPGPILEKAGSPSASRSVPQVLRRNGTANSQAWQRWDEKITRPGFGLKSAGRCCSAYQEFLLGRCKFFVRQHA